jgi:hypothetical protein
MKSFRLFDRGVIRSASSLKAFQESTALYLNQSYLQENHLEPIQYNLIFIGLSRKEAMAPLTGQYSPRGELWASPSANVNSLRETQKLNVTALGKLLR